MTVVTIRIGGFWCRVLEEREDAFLVRDPVWYLTGTDVNGKRQRRPPREWIRRDKVLEIRRVNKCS
jgi:hypothetical protein